MKYASWGTRALATLIDALILFIPFLVLQAVLLQIPLGFYIRGIVSSAVLGGLMAGYNYYFLMQSGQTPGKKVMKIKVVTESGKALDQDVLVKREVLAKLAPSIVGSLIPVLGSLAAAVYFLVAYLMPLWDTKKQTLMDRFAGTVVIPA